MSQLQNSETIKNLMRAFAGESQARNRYTIGAAQAKVQGLHVIDAIFTFTANQEKEHAEIFYNHMKELAGQTITIDGGYPLDFSDSMPQLLRMAEHNENEEYTTVYKSFADVAREEGFAAVASSFEMIGSIEDTHAKRFAYFAQLMEEGKLFVSDVSSGWMCLNCGYIYNGREAPDVCPVCKHDKGFFIRIEFAPFTK